MRLFRLTAPARAILPLGLLMLAACAAPAPDAGLPLLGPYREPADECRRVGESPATVEYLDDMADLVACPVGYAGIPIFIMDVKAVQVGEAPGYLLYSVPRPLTAF